MNVLSLFDGISSGRLALRRLGITINNYYASEINKHATKVSDNNFPDIVRLGDINNWREWQIDWPSIDIIFAGFPCQSWSVAGQQAGDKDDRGMLFWVMLHVMTYAKKHNPNLDFLIENVKMKKDFERYITENIESKLGSINKILINSALVSAQNRNRYYWTSFPVTQPEDKGIKFYEILEENPTNAMLANECLKNGRQGNYIKCGAIRGRYIVDGKRQDSKLKSVSGLTQQRIELRKDNKSNTLSTVQKDNVVCFVDESELMPSTIKWSNDKRVIETKNHKFGCLTATYSKGLPGTGRPFISHKSCIGKHISECNDITKNTNPITNRNYRKLTPLECERLQTFDDNFTAGISNSQRYIALGNAWTVDVIVHILSCFVAYKA